MFANDGVPWFKRIDQAPSVGGIEYLGNLITSHPSSLHHFLLVDGSLSSSTGRSGVKAAPVPLRSLSSPPPSAVPLTPPLMAGACVRRKPSTNKEAEVEETIGYEALFSPEEWASMKLAQVSEDDDWGAHDEDPLGPPTPSGHRVAVCFPPGEYEGNEDRYELQCDVCSYVGAADSMKEAKVIARLHETFVATLAENSTSVIR